jgi:hypothetical protein
MDLDFGLDAQSLAEICGGDHGWADAIIDAFGGTNGMCVTVTSWVFSVEVPPIDRVPLSLSLSV